MSETIKGAAMLVLCFVILGIYGNLQEFKSDVDRAGDRAGMFADKAEGLIDKIAVMPLLNEGGKAVPEPQPAPNPKPAPKPQPSKTAIMYLEVVTDSSYCIPCRKWEAECEQDMRKLGWEIRKRKPNAGETIPYFTIVSKDGVKRYGTRGYTSRTSFANWVNRSRAEIQQYYKSRGKVREVEVRPAPTPAKTISPVVVPQSRVIYPAPVQRPVVYPFARGSWYGSSYSQPSSYGGAACVT